MEILLIYFLVINVLEFVIAGFDKFAAIKQKRRIPENTLFFLAFIGGSIGLLIAMLLFRHKTSKISFIVKFGTIIVIQVLLYYFLYYKK
jgi:uncharacterized membrane protein YsdA (DUF1294 family)